MAHPPPDLDPRLRKSYANAVPVRYGHEAVPVAPHRHHPTAITIASGLEYLAVAPGVNDRSRALAGAIDQGRGARGHPLDDAPLRRLAVCDHRHVANGHGEPAR